MDGLETSKTDGSGEQTTSYTTTAINSPAASCKARRNWQLARRHLIDKVTLLETTIQRYRTQVASSSATITAKDIVISRLQKETTELRDKLELKDKKIEKLESQLAISAEDKASSERKLEMLLEELQNIDLNATAKLLCSPEKTPKSDSQNKRKLLKKENPVFSFLANHVSYKHEKHDKKNSTLSPRLLLGRTLRDKENARSRPNTPEIDKPEDYRSQSETYASESEKHDDAEAQSDTDTAEEYSDDLGSKACAIM
ncbi:uncharacterized protein LOC128553353 [Mercenaria mercenaria]|uniref:uncharacterized protein LOC128553353 n=1 Tax=Mercenaria mercenaria TaxID=6596 RepID=UPI00234F72CC|nr:uncharacterized protein LOC128553353 [Mercenaria mercenaria]XP_053390553.1 uncharacterized protein LOC128553353 [Mercenaria mercenaria]